MIGESIVGKLQEVFYALPNENKWCSHLQNKTNKVYPLGTTIIYSCKDPRRTLFRGNEYRVCQQNGAWSGRKPSCRKFIFIQVSRT